MKYFLISIVCILASWLLINLVMMWEADKSYALGKNLDGAGQFTTAYSFLNSAVSDNPEEPTFRDELAFNQATLAVAVFEKEATNSALPILISQAIANSNLVTKNHPNSLPFWKGRVKVFYELSLIDKKYLPPALEAIKTAVQLAPTDAKIRFNLGLILAKTGQKEAARKVFEETLKLKPDYEDVKKVL